MRRLTPGTRFGLRLAVGALLLFLILSRVGLPALGQTLVTGVIPGILGAALLLLLGQAVAALRWKVVLGDGSPRWSYLVRLYLIGGFFSLFLPTMVGGDAVRAIAASRATARPGGTVASVVIDRSLGVLALMIYAIAGMVLMPDFSIRLLQAAQLHVRGWAVALAAVALLIVVVAGGFLLRRSTRLRDGLRDAGHAARELVNSPRQLLLALTLALVVQGIYLLLWLVLARATALPIPPGTLLLAVPVVTACAMLPITLNGLGVREGAWLLLLSGQGIPPAQIVTFSLLYFLTNLVTGVVGGLVFVVRGTEAVSSERQSSN